MKMTVKTSAVVFFVALAFALLPYDIYQVGLGAMAAILCMWIASCIHHKWARVGTFVVLSITSCQLLVLARRAICEQGLYETLRTNPIRMIGGDIAYGFKHVAMTVAQSVIAVINYCCDEAAIIEIEDLNPRLFVVGWMIVAITVGLLLKSQPKPQPQ